MYSASVRGREVFAFAILSSHDVFVAFQSIWAQGFVAAGPAKPQPFFYGMPAVIWILGESIGSSGSPYKQRLRSIMVHKRDSEKPRLALTRPYQLLSVFYFAY